MVLKFKVNYKNRTVFVYFIIELENEHVIICNYYEKDEFDYQSKPTIWNVEKLRGQFKISDWTEI